MLPILLVYATSIIFVAYFLYTRFWRLYSQMNFYKRQGVPFHPGVVPIFGSFIIMGRIAKTAVNNPIVDFLKELYYSKGDAKVPPFVAITGPLGVALAVGRPEAVQELFLSKNKYFDKHPTTA